MKQSYDDIMDKLGEPEWYDLYGVPRYGNPDELPAEFFTDVFCQHCGKQFRVAVVDSVYKQPGGRYVDQNDEQWTLIRIGEYYGDPPRHDCMAGNTMSTLTKRDLEEGL